ncbi:MAG: SDR family oxidoreductase [Gammaproteobacteria bacterium]|nr:SDR family oxidoreductase [Gammaproteobacteria bacterium]MDH5652472.1 SDR family oxidoreductase [Gammaproteobacteria bacterium]
MSRILVTGATGFVGKRLLTMLYERGHATLAAIRRASSSVDVAGESVVVGDIHADTNWQPVLQGIDVVVHLAARVHVMQETESDPLTAFRQVNTEGTRRLAEAAAAAGVKRLVYISSIKVNGEETTDQPFTAADPVNVPLDPYAQSKWEAEQLLKEISRRTGLEVVIIRPPLVYGPGVKANFLSLIKLARLGLPLPLGSIHNRRTLVALDNLADLIALCCEHPAAAGEVFLAGDDETLSTAELVSRIRRALGMKARVFRFPPGLMAFAAGLFGKQAVWRRLNGSLAVDNSAAKQRLGWQPVTSMDEELQRIIMQM